MSTTVAISPDSAEAVAAALRDARSLRIRGAGTKLDWGRPSSAAQELSTARLSGVVEHNEGDLTAVVQAGVPLAAAQERFASAGQMLALDPPGAEATIGGIVASGDSGPLRHRYGAPRDLVLGVQVALADGSVARAGSKVIKNVAGYDLAKLMAGAFGTLGVITELSLRLHPQPQEAVTAIAHGADPTALVMAASTLAHLPLEPDALDLRWARGSGAVLVRLSGPSAPQRAEQALAAIPALEGAVVADHEPLWRDQREGQRGAVVVRVSTTQRGLEATLAAAQDLDAAVVARAALGLAWLRLAEASADTITALRVRLAPAPCVLLDAPAGLRAEVDPWGTTDGDPAGALARAIKARFDPRGVCNPGLFVGGL